MKKNKISKPRTIADLKFNWEFVNYPLGYTSIEIAYNQISKLNSNLKKFRVTPNSYLILVNDKTINIKIYDTSINVIDFFEIICFRCFINNFPITGHFSHFERIDDHTYRIHMKS